MEEYITSQDGRLIATLAVDGDDRGDHERERAYYTITIREAETGDALFRCDRLYVFDHRTEYESGHPIHAISFDPSGGVLLLNGGRGETDRIPFAAIIEATEQALEENPDDVAAYQADPASTPKVPWPLMQALKTDDADWVFEDALGHLRRRLNEHEAPAARGGGVLRTIRAGGAVLVVGVLLFLLARAVRLTEVWGG